MFFDNRKTVVRVYLRKMIIASVTVFLIIGIMATGWFENDVLGIPKNWWIIIVTFLYICTIIISWMRLLNYIYFSDEGDKIIIRYYPIRPLVQKKKAIQIPKIGLVGYDIRSSMLGLRTSIVFKQRVKGKIATYPPIGITALKKKELELLRKQVERYVRP